jgi:hypothetical protein
MPRHQLSKLEILEYALDGARTWRGLNAGNLSESEAELLDKDIKEIQRRIRIINSQQADKET